MKKNRVAIVLLAAIFSAFSLQKKNVGYEKVKSQSQKFGEALRTESLNEAIDLMDNETILLPEYHKSLWGKGKIREYFTQFFAKTETISYSKEPFEILDLGEYFIELGTFEHQYKTPDSQNFDYYGKYATYWKVSDGENPRVIAHIWGASSYFEAENVNFVSIDVRDRETMEFKTRWEKEIEEMRRFSYEAVFEGDAKTQLKSYADDATYMTYYDPPFIGKDNITKYFESHYNPDVPKDSLMTRSVKVIDMGDYALKFGEYYVEWTWEGQPSYIEGKGLTLYKRMKDDGIKIYKQMINHSMPASPK
ncbi:DUF4440 domain-containing protein [Flagellimonas meridianipacifica]|uniref:Ketosteroid isomerase-like protein n=1 Tax=Flagellimonas meridianipacifica TaxID=1080225 RepID=A0A2T0MC16_9FLAO|nr:DUF4440 domain-containing protein [Allomuricauda pacifica]PRX55039.1 ketosteroid isomerase-like protein [Allomuricauda pacifica]